MTPEAICTMCGRPYAVAASGGSGACPRCSKLVTNPYAAPAIEGEALAPVALRPLTHSKIRFWDAIWTAWRVFSTKPYRLMVGLIFINLLTMILTTCGLIALYMLWIATGMIAAWVDEALNTNLAAISDFNTDWVLLLFTYLCSAPLYLCWTNSFTISLARGEATFMEQVPAATLRLPAMFVGSLIMLLLTKIPDLVAEIQIDQSLGLWGVIISVWLIPQAVLLAVWGLYSMFVVDRSAGGIEALKLARRYSQNNRWILFCYFACTILFSHALTLLFSEIGSVIAMEMISEMSPALPLSVYIIGVPLAMFACLLLYTYSVVLGTVLYLRMTGQATLLEPRGS